MIGRFNSLGRRADALPSSNIRIPSIGTIEETAVKSHLLCVVALGLVAAASTASAQDAKSININSTIGTYCQSLSIQPAPLNLGSLVDGQGRTATTFAGPTERSLGNYYCTGPAKLTLLAQPLLQNEGGEVNDPSSFTKRVDYKANFTWGSSSQTNNSAASAASAFETQSANTGEIKIVVSDPVAPLRPIAGAYVGSVVLTVGPK